MPLQSASFPGRAPIALITGITGQDGGYLAAFLLERGYIVHGLSRDVSRLDRGRFAHIVDLNRRLHLHSCDMIDAAGLSRLLETVRAEEIYNLAAQTHIQTSFDDPAYTTDVNATGAVRLLNALVKLDLTHRTRFYQASSSEMFGDAKGKIQNEDTPLHPLSPYAVAKHAAFEATVNFREAFGVHASNGILFNHESPWRGTNFVTRKIARAVAMRHAGDTTPLKLGNLDTRRDWGHARDYVEGMWLMLQRDEPDDYVLATGEHHSVREFVELAFSETGRDIVWRGEGIEEIGFDASTGETLVEVDPAFFRPTDISITIGDASKAQRVLGWRRRTSFPELVSEMVVADIDRLERMRGSATGSAD
ncbi:MAG: GDP-mannose 4,6-dehydratase [Parvibaculum sp.]